MDASVGIPIDIFLDSWIAEALAYVRLPGENLTRVHSHVPYQLWNQNETATLGLKKNSPHFPPRLGIVIIMSLTTALFIQASIMSQVRIVAI